MAYPFANNPSNPEAKPLYNDNILKVWNWFSTVWSCDDWTTWHKAMVAKYGLDDANHFFLQEWNNLATGSSAIDCRSFNTAFRDYMKKVGLIDSIYSGIGIVAKPIGAAGDAVGNISSAVSSGTKTLKLLVPIVIVVIVTILLIAVYKRTKGK